MAPPMLPLAICCMSINSGNTSERPASASAPSRPTKYASTLAVQQTVTIRPTSQIGELLAKLGLVNVSIHPHCEAPLYCSFIYETIVASQCQQGTEKSGTW